MLRLIQSEDERDAFLCQVCIADSGGQQSGTMRSSRNASNLYSHCKLVRPEIHTIIAAINNFIFIYLVIDYYL